MGWTFPWYSSYGSDFNYDFHATLDDSRRPGGVQLPHRGRARRGRHTGTGGRAADRGAGDQRFLRDGDEVFHTYSTYGRGTEEFHGGYHYLDLTALGRQEEWEEPKDRVEQTARRLAGVRQLTR